MSSTDFQAVLASFRGQGSDPATNPARSGSGAAPPLDRVAVLGGGIEGQALAAWFLAGGAEAVSLFSVYADDLDELSGGVTVRGTGPIGSYRTDGDGPRIEVTSVLEQALADAELVVMTGSVLKQRTYALVLADRLSDGQVLLIAPGRTFGALETSWWLRIGGAPAARVTVAELSNLPFTVERRGTALYFGQAPAPAMATLPSLQVAVTDALARYFPTAVAVPTVLHSSFADYAGAVDAALLLAGGPALDRAPALPIGAIPVTTGTMADLVGPGQLDLIEQLVAERRAVAERWGVRDLGPVDDAIAAAVGDGDEDGSQTIPATEAARGRLRCAVLGSLVPLLSAADLASEAGGTAGNLDVSATASLVGLARSVLGGDLDGAGRRLDRLGLQADTMSSVRRALDRYGIGWS